MPPDNAPPFSLKPRQSPNIRSRAGGCRSVCRYITPQPEKQDEANGNRYKKCNFTPGTVLLIKDRHGIT